MYDISDSMFYCSNVLDSSDLGPCTCVIAKTARLFIGNVPPDLEDTNLEMHGQTGHEPDKSLERTTLTRSGMCHPRTI